MRYRLRFDNSCFGLARAKGGFMRFIGGLSTVSALAAIAVTFLSVSPSAPTGDAVPINIEIGGVGSRQDVTMAVK